METVETNQKQPKIKNHTTKQKIDLTRHGPYDDDNLTRHGPYAYDKTRPGIPNLIQLNKTKHAASRKTLFYCFLVHSFL